MLRAVSAFLLMFVPALVLLTTAGCGEKSETVQQSERRIESEPEMRSPGVEVVE